jgi:hypothetical protein
MLTDEIVLEITDRIYLREEVLRRTCNDKFPSYIPTSSLRLALTIN